MNPLVNNMSNQMQGNQMYENIMNLVKGKDPKTVFFDECQKRGVDPQAILRMMK